MLIICATQIEASRVQNEVVSNVERNKEEAKMELLATYGDDGDKSESPGHSSDVSEKEDASPVAARVPSSFTPYLQAEWESFEKLIAGGGESQEDTTHNAQIFAPIPPVADFSTGSNTIQEIHRREPDDNTMVNESHLHSQSSLHGYLSNSASNSTSSSRSSSLDRATDSKKINEEVINVASRSPSKSVEPRSCSTSPVAVIQESPDRHSGSDSPVHSSPSRSRSNSTGRYSHDQSPDPQQAAKSRSRSRSSSQSRSHRRSRSHSRSSRHRKKHSHKSRSQSRSRRHRRSRTPHKKSKHRRRSHSRDKHRSREHKRSRSRDRFGRNMRGRDNYKERSPASSRRRSRSRERSRDRESHRNAQRDYGRRDPRDCGSGRSKDNPLNFKEQMRQELIKASKMLNESSVEDLTEMMEDKKLESSSDQPGITLNSAVLTNLAAATQNSTVTPQVALLQTMAAMHKKAQEMTGIAVPKYYNPAAVNPLKYAEQVQKRKLLWSRPPKEKKVGGPENQWQGTHFSTDQDGKMAAKFRKLMGMRSGEEEGEERVGEERKKQQEELFTRLDKEYEFARMATHTHRGVGLGFQSQNFYQH